MEARTRFACPCDPEKSYASRSAVTDRRHLMGTKHLAYEERLRAERDAVRTADIEAGRRCLCDPTKLFASDGFASSSRHTGSAVHRAHELKLSRARSEANRRALEAQAAEEAKAASEDAKRAEAPLLYGVVVELAERVAALEEQAKMFESDIQSLEDRDRGW